MRAPLAAVLVLVGVLLLGIWLGGHSSDLPAPLRDFARDDEMEVVDAVIDRVAEDYYRRIPRDELADAAAEGVVRGLDDRFSNYFDAQEYARFRERSHARFTGIGVSVQGVDSGLRVVEVYERSPARGAGLRSGDVIVAADGTRLAGKPEDVASSLIRGREGTSVRLTIERARRRIRTEVRRAQVAIPVVRARMVERGGRTDAVVRLATFSSGSHAEVYAAVRRAQRRRVDGVVFDLRGNGGGLVEEARLVASAFLPEGTIVTTRGRAVPDRVYRSTGDPIAPRTPLVVLVDEGTASAAEIVAGALQDRDRATLAGTRTFGKGVFQEVVELGNGGALDITVGQYFLPSGRNIGGEGVQQGDGLAPDVRAKDDPATRERDEALDRALLALRDPAR